MALVATIEGVDVYSDKEVSRIKRTKVKFTDGSWCDVASNRVVNRGIGEIRLEKSGSSQSAKPTTLGPTHYKAGRLELRGISADVSVIPHDGSGMEVTISGPKDKVDAIRVNARLMTLVIEEDSSSNMNSISVSGRGQSIIIGNGNIVMSGSGGRFTSISGGNINGERAKVIVKVPVGTPITLNASAGSKTTIGNINGTLNAKLSSSASLRAESATDSVLNASSSGRIELGSISGTAVLQASSSGSINIGSGRISQLNASASSSGSIFVRTTANTAVLQASSSGNIRVDHVVNNPSQSSSSSGQVSVGRIG